MWKKRMLAIVMAMLMVFSLLPSMVFAAAPSGELGGKLKMKGKAEVGSKLSADYKKVTPEGVTDDYVSFLWSRKEGETLTEVGKEKTYTVVDEDLGTEIVLEIKGLEDMGMSGKLKVTSEIIAAQGEGTDATASEETEEEQTEEIPEEEQAEEISEEESTGEEAELQNTEELAVQEEENYENPESEELGMEETLEPVDEESVSPETENSEIGTEEFEIQTEENYDEQDQMGAADEYSMEATTEDGTGVLDFGSVEDGKESEVEPKYISIKNTGTGTLVFDEIRPDYFVAEDITEPLAPGETVNLRVWPREELEPGSYQDTIAYTSQEGETGAVEASVTIKEKEQTEVPQPVYAIRVESSVLEFAPLIEGYEKAEEVQKVQVYNDGNTDVTLNMAKNDFFEVYFSEEENQEAPVIHPGESHTVQIRPVSGLTLGEYRGDLVFSIKESESVQASVTASVTVKKEELPQIAVSIDPSSVQFDTVKEGYQEAPEAKSITVTNTGTEVVALEQPQAKNYRIGELSKEILNPGESASFTVQPKQELKAGEYNGKIAVKNAEDSSTLTGVEVSFKVEVKEESYKLSVKPDMLDFGSVEEGYGEAPKAQTVTVTNAGTGTIHLTQPQSEYFNVGALSALVLKAGESASFTLQPKQGLTESEYLEVVQIGNDAQVQALVNAYFDVKEVGEKLVEVQKFKEISGIRNGAEKSVKGLKLPASAVIRTSKGKAKAAVTWNLKDAAYNPKNTEKQTFSVNGKITLPKGVKNPDGISQKVSVKVSVKQYEPKIPSTDKNYISGIKGEGYTTESKITFTAVGAGVDNAHPRKGDVRYLPLNWTVLNTNSWSTAPYTASFGISQKGSYTLSVVYNQQKFDGSNWVNTGEQDTKKVGFQVAAAANAKLTPTPGANQKHPVKTGDDTPILPFVIALVAAVAIGAGVIIYRKKK